MLRLPIWRRMFPCTLLAVGGLCAYAVPPSPQQSTLPLEKQVALHIKEATYPKLIAEVSRICNMSIISDVHTPKGVRTFKFEGTLRELLDELATTYDGSWAPSKSGIIRLGKRFTSPTEQPPLIDAELVATAKDIASLLPEAQPIELPIGWAPQLTRIMESITPMQREILVQGGKLELRDLSPTQREALRGVVYTRGFGQAKFQAQRIRDVFQSLAKSEISVVPLQDDNPVPGAPLVVNVMHTIKTGAISDTFPLGQVNLERKP